MQNKEDLTCNVKQTWKTLGCIFSHVRLRCSTLPHGCAALYDTSWKLCAQVLYLVTPCQIEVPWSCNLSLRSLIFSLGGKSRRGSNFSLEGKIQGLCITVTVTKEQSLAAYLYHWDFTLLTQDVSMVTHLCLQAALVVLWEMGLLLLHSLPAVEWTPTAFAMWLCGISHCKTFSCPIDAGFDYVICMSVAY